jgi:hypothetical protein
MIRLGRKGVFFGSLGLSECLICPIYSDWREQSICILCCLIEMFTLQANLNLKFPYPVDWFCSNIFTSVLYCNYSLLSGGTNCVLCDSVIARSDFELLVLMWI